MIKKDLQQGTDEWLHWRKGKITGTTLKSIMGTPKAREEALYEVVSERLMNGVDEMGEFGNMMERGNALEPDAIAAFELEKGLHVQREGGQYADDNALMANSPDGLIGEHEAVEVKCLGAKNHVKMWLKNEIPDEYKWQVVQYFIVNKELKKLYFVGYHPDITEHPLHIIEKTREQAMADIEKARAAQEVFLAEVEEILSKIIKEL